MRPRLFQAPGRSRSEIERGQMAWFAIILFIVAVAMLMEVFR